MRTDYKHVAELIARIKLQDEDAFEELYHCMYQRVYFMAMSIVKDEYLAQDVVQETFIIVYRNILKLEENTAFAAWINRITYHCSLKLLVKNKKVPLDEEQEAAVNDQGPLDTVLLKEKAQTIMHFIWKLPEEYKTVMLLKYYEGMKLKEIADCLECNVGTVKSRLSRGKAALRKQLSGKGLLGTILLTSCVGLRVSITSYAKDYAISESAAGSILESSKAALGIRSEIKLFGSASKGYPLLVKGGVVGVLITGVIAAGALAGVRPVITVARSNDAYTNEAVFVTINVKSYLPVKSIQITDAGGRSLNDWSRGKGSYGAKICQNGQYKAEATLLNGERAELEFEIVNIDQELPKLNGYSWDTDKGSFYCRISDSQSGIDYARIYAESSDGSVQKPISCNTGTGEIEFSLSDPTFYIYLYDNSGNFAKYRIYREPF